jgi:predicted nucleic acid-binding protein
MYTLDTNIISYFFKQNMQVTEKILDKFENLSLPVLVCSECLFGARKIQNLLLEEKYYTFFESFKIYDFDFVASDLFAVLKADLQKKGKIVEDFDLMIASICISNNLTLITNNTKHFQNIPNLKLEDWTK